MDRVERRRARLAGSPGREFAAVVGGAIALVFAVAPLEGRQVGPELPVEVLVEGVVLDPAGAPVAGVAVHLDECWPYDQGRPLESECWDWGPLRVARSDADGRFTFARDPADRFLSDAPLRVRVEQPGFAPLISRSFDRLEPPQELSMQLVPGRSLRVRFKTPKGLLAGLGPGVFLESSGAASKRPLVHATCQDVLFPSHAVGVHGIEFVTHHVRLALGRAEVAPDSADGEPAACAMALEGHWVARVLELRHWTGDSLGWREIRVLPAGPSFAPRSRRLTSGHRIELPLPADARELEVRRSGSEPLRLTLGPFDPESEHPCAAITLPPPFAAELTLHPVPHLPEGAELIVQLEHENARPGRSTRFPLDAGGRATVGAGSPGVYRAVLLVRAAEGFPVWHIIGFEPEQRARILASEAHRRDARARRFPDDVWRAVPRVEMSADECPSLRFEVDTALIETLARAWRF